ncbi:phenylacetate-CoA ligase [Dysgonomonas sp. PH5-45]|uniref:phenylacetate--CoA ligase family protein n=1 Tax=unclassified Dysgonomonas TaxID=2630389 RepID=UPI0024762902|nr:MULTISPECIES: phenylacetate--CoA ligase family protein [unclassified Dysgonomonas]MDH6354388.1 phenylacetate-CoA ligase [Dysgonomonas sp. PH5-45]MDH6387287.1 phenylacetate-CoA ligase [Dysgonomonas sp. PH5-37]
MALKEKLYRISPHIIQGVFISLFNFLAYRKRYGGKYKEFRKLFKERENISLEELKKIQTERKEEFLSYVIRKSSFYKKIYAENNDEFPIVTKELLRSNLKDVYTINKINGIVSKTGGTTGKSLEVLFTPEDMQERFAMLDNFRAKFGYELGKKTAWFSGKTLLTHKDVKKNIFWKTDYFYKVRYYSTFHIKNDYLKYYLENLIEYEPEYIVGFPSSILEIAKYGIQNGYDFPNNKIKAIFPTAETITNEIRNTIESFFKTNMYDQYASSEGAPFIFECKNHKLHMELQSGIFEVLDENNEFAQQGKLVLTSFTTHGTPLIRYDIGDMIKLSHETCTCGNNNPIVKEILGRIDDYIYSPDNGKINLGNVSNTLKGTKGIIKFQAIQNKLDLIEIQVVVDNEIFNEKISNVFLLNWQERVGNNMKIEIKKVNDIPNEKSGKYRLVKNNIKHLIK